MAFAAAALGTLVLPGAAVAQDFSAQVKPNPATMEAGGPARNVSVTTSPDPGFQFPITYSFSGFPAGISTGGQQMVNLPYPAATFVFAADPNVPRGTYVGSLVGTTPGGSKSFPMTIVVVNPDFSLSAVPSTVSIERGGTVSVTVMAMPIDGFSGSVSVATPTTPGIAFDPASFELQPGESRSVTITASPAASVGTITGDFVGTANGIAGQRTAPLTIQVTAPPPPPPPPQDFSLSVSPASLSLAPGESGVLTVSASGIGGFDDPIMTTASPPAGISIVPSSFNLSPGGSQTVTVTAGPVAPAGTATLVFMGTAAPGSRTATASVVVTAAPAPPPPEEDFSLTLSPSSLSLAPGESGVLNVSAAGMGGFSGLIMTGGAPPAGISIAPSSFTLSPGGSQAVTVTAAPAAPAGTLALVFTGTAAGIPGTRTISASVTVTAPASAPVIHAITPPSVVTGTTGNVLRVTGRNFAPGATIALDSPGVSLVAARVLGPGAAEVVVAVRPGAPPGPVGLEITNPDGGSATGGATILVYPSGALSAPLAVTAAAIVAPRPWQILDAGESIHAQALLATSGMGTVVGTWLLDGVPFDRFTRVVASGYPVEVRSLVPIPISFIGEHRLELVIESPQSLPPEEVPFFLAVESSTELKVLTPDPGAMMDSDAPLFRWTLVPGASGYEVEVADPSDVESDARPWRLRRRVTDTEWRADDTILEMLGTGPKRFRVRAVFPGEIAGEPTPWVPFLLPGRAGRDASTETSRTSAPFRLVSTARNAVAARDTISGQEESLSTGQLGLSLMNTTSTIASEFEDPPPLTRLQLSTQTDFRNGSFDQQATADLSGSQDIEDPWNAREESRNWLTHLGATQGGFREEFALGFAPPSFFDQTEFLTVASSGGAYQGTFASPAGRLAYYRSVDLSANDGFSGFEPDIEAAAYEASDQAGRFLFRTMWLAVTDPEVEGFSAGGDGRAVGVIGVAQLRPWLRFLGEAAGGEFDPGEGGFEEARDGKAFRLGLDGTAGTFGYAFTVGRTGEGFVNPANRGFTPGGISDRTQTELSLQKSFGRAVLSGGYRHVRGGIHESAGDSRTTENGTSVQLALPLGQRVSFNLSGNIVGQRGDAVVDLGLPRTDRTQKGADLNVTETVGPFSLSQAVTWQDFADRVQPLNDQTVTGLSFAANGSLTSYFNLSANVSNTRTEAPEIGATNQLLLSLQPAVTLDELWLAITPRTAWMRVTSDFEHGEFRSDQYQLVVRWSPPWLGALFNIEVASDWNRSWPGLDVEPPSFDRQTVFTLTLNWRADRTWQPTAASAMPHAQLASR